MPRRMCEMKIPEDLVAKIDETPTGMGPVLASVEKEFNLSTTSSYIGKKNHFIIGPNPDILELAVETLRQRFFPREVTPDSRVDNQVENGQAIWRFHGDYAIKASHLFTPEIEELQQYKSVRITIKPIVIDISVGYEDLETVKPKVDKLKSDIDDLHHEDVSISPSPGEMGRLRLFIQRKQHHARTVVCILNERTRTMTVYGKTEMNVRNAVDEWKMGNQPTNQSSPRSPRSPCSYKATSPTREKFRNELKIPRGIVAKLENQRCGMGQIISGIEREFGLKLDYVRHKHLVIFGPHVDILELAAQTLVHRYVLKSTPENGVLGQLQGKNAVWRFLGSYAKKVGHLFKAELNRLQRIGTVSVRCFPSRINPSYVEVLCSYRMVDTVKTEVEKMVGLVHNLVEKEWEVPNKASAITRVKDFLKEVSETNKKVLCRFDEQTRKLYVCGKNEAAVHQVLNELQEERDKISAKSRIPEEYWRTHRQMYQTRVSDKVVEKLERVPGGIMPVLQKIEKEYGVRTLLHRNKQMVLISSSQELLELASDTLENRYSAVQASSRGSPERSFLDSRASRKPAGGTGSSRDKGLNVSFEV